MSGIQERNQKFLESLQGNIGKYLSFLSTMARFHKYEVADLTSFAIEAPAMFTAVANKELWERHFRRKIKPNAKGVTLIKDGKETVYYDVSETESAIKDEIEVKLWRFDNFAHKKFLDAVVSDEKSAEKQIKIIAEELANRTDIDEKSKKLLALSVESVILERMGFSTENATRQLAKISFKEQDIPKILNETQATAKIFLDAMQKSVTKNASENLDIPENNPLLEKIGVIKTAEKIQEPELKLEIQEEIIQNGLFDEVVDYQVAEKSEEKIVEEVQIADSEKISVAEVNSEEVSVQNSEIVDAELVEEKVLEEISESTTTSDAENISEEPEKNISEEIPTQNPEVIEAEFVEKNPAEIFETDEQNNSDYDFEEMDEEEEILPDSSEQQNNVEILTENNSEQNSDVETATETSEISTPDLQTVLAEDMAVIRGNNFEKNVFRKNVTAIRTLQFIEKEKRNATPEEIEVLKNYAGFGGIPKAFDKTDPNWNREAWLLQSMLTEKEYSDARGSTLNAHYTSKEIVQGIYSGLQNLGFQQGTILEPSMGVGGFFGNMPDEMKNGSHLFGVELDSVTGRIAQKIYPDAEISVQGFEDTRYLNNSFDVAVGNVPFGNYRVNDKSYNQNHFLIHDYFIAKMIDQVRPGGVVAVITSRGTLDKQDSSARKYFARRADLIRAIRLPNNAFKSAGTEVTSDILFFKNMRDSVRNVIDIQVNDGSDDELKKAQAELNNLYDKYVGIYGHICEDSNLKKIFNRDSAYPLLRSLEEYGKDGYKGKSPIFSKRMIEPHRRPTYADNPADALAISMQEVGQVDLGYMKSLTGKSEEEIVRRCIHKKIVI